MGRRARLIAAGSVLVAVVAASCSGGDREQDSSGQAGAGRDGHAPTGLMVAIGEDDMIALDGTRVVPLEGLVEEAADLPGPWMATPPSARTNDGLAVLVGGQVTLVTADGAAQPTPCRGCTSSAAAGDRLVTVRRNWLPGGRFDIVFLDADLQVDEVVPARRLSERLTSSSPDENTDTPQVLHATAERVTVSYLAESGGVRAGPSVIAHYATDGQVLDSVLVDGLVWGSAASPDGSYIALGSGGSGGACVTANELGVVRLDDLTLSDVRPAVPGDVTADWDDLDGPWFELTDLRWQDDNVVVATGLAHTSSQSDDGVCGNATLWERSFDVTAGAFVEESVTTVWAQRWIGPDCGDVVQQVGAEQGELELVARVDGVEKLLGPYGPPSRGPMPPEDC